MMFVTKRLINDKHGRDVFNKSSHAIIQQVLERFSSYQKKACRATPPYHSLSRTLAFTGILNEGFVWWLLYYEHSIGIAVTEIIKPIFA